MPQKYKKKAKVAFFAIKWSVFNYFSPKLSFWGDFIDYPLKSIDRFRCG